MLDVVSGKHIKTIDIAPNQAPHGIQWLPGTGSVVVTVQGANNVIELEVDSGRVTRSVSTGQDDSHLIVLTSDAARGFVTNRGSSTVSVIDMGTFQSIDTLVCDDGAESIDISPDDRTLWVGNRRANTTSVFDINTLTKTRTMDVGYDPVRLQFSRDGKHVAVADFSRDRLVIYDAASGQQEDVLDLHEAGIAEPAHLLFSPDGTRLYASGQKNGKVAEIDAADIESRAFHYSP